jgi:rubrerythrin
VRWELPQTFDDEGTGTASPGLVTPYRALSMAVRNEERAFTFWGYIAAHAESHEIGQAAESMAREELGHVALLRRERRRAYHQQRWEIREARYGEPVGSTATLERQLAREPACVTVN